jgi:hypothetical protein
MKNYIDRSMTFDEYVAQIDRLLADGKTTGPKQSEEMFGYARLNRQRMWRLEKTVRLEPETIMMTAANERKMFWLIITEGWCGDAAQNIPVIEKIAAESANIETRYILRDENLELIDRFLTNGARSIPKLIAVDAVTYEVLGTWGARPARAQQFFDELKAQGLEKAEISERLQRWYNEDKSRSIQREFVDLVEQWQNEPVARAA